MTAKEKIEKLTHAWYGADLVAGIASILMNGIGVFSILIAGFSTVVSFVFTFVIGRLLVNRISLARYSLIFFSGLFAILGVLSVGRMALAFFTEWSLSYLGYALFAAMGVYMNGRSFRVLTDKSVAAYFG